MPGTEVSRRQWRLVVVLVIGLPLIAACDGASQRHSAIDPVPRDAAWLKRHEQINARIEQGNVDLVFIGDSITHGWEGAGREVWDSFYGKRNAANLGVSGDLTQHVIWRLRNGNLEGIQPTVAVVLIGTNNGLANTPEETAAGVKEIVSTVRKKCPATNIVLMGILPCGDQDNQLRIVNRHVNRLIAGLDDDPYVFYLDIGDRFLDEHGTLSPELMPDLLHPSAAGYLIWSEAIEPTIARLMEEM